MENLIRRIQAGQIFGAEPVLVISDNPQAGAISKAERLRVPVRIVERKNFLSKPEFENAIIRHLEASQIDLIALAGFMKILSPDFVKRYRGRIINIHPAYLPDFRGAHAIRDAFEAKVKETGVTVHFVDEGVDTGPIILQRKVPIDPQDTLESLEAKIHAVEYELYPEALRLVISGKAKFPLK
ncbi:MAG: phosphoribosylglycinamide formyltransferase [Candidatus Omnitrophica bacterium]|nr:phosphoribosylglycinamide formyltransferase [Candidatus Omnitrophota bacterium]